MSRKVITLAGKEYPCRLTIGAMVAYKNETGEDFTRFNGENVERLGQIVFFACRSACHADGTEFPFKQADEILDFLDIEQVTDVLGMNTAGMADGQDGASAAKKN